MTPDHTAFQVRSSRLCRAGIGRSSWEGFNTGRHEKAPVRCPYSRLAALNGASQPIGCTSWCFTADWLHFMVLHSRLAALNGASRTLSYCKTFDVKR